MEPGFGPSSGSGDVWGHAQLLPNGDILVPEKTKSRFELVRMAWDGSELWHVDVRAHHDAEIRPDGLVSTLSFAERREACVAIFDWTNKKMAWQWGRDAISGSHDATVLENGIIPIFDNGLQRGWSRAVEVDPLTKEIVWEYFRIKRVEPALQQALRERFPNLPGGASSSED